MLETPDLVFALPLTPESHRGARGGIATVGEIDVEVGVADGDAEKKGSVGVRSSVIVLANLPISIVVPFVGVDVPSARAGGLDSYDLTSILQGALDVEILLVVRVLERPAITGVLNLPLHEKVRTPC